MEKVREVTDQARQLYSSTNFVNTDLIPIIDKFTNEREAIVTTLKEQLDAAIEKDQNGSHGDVIRLCNSLLVTLCVPN